MSHSQEQSELYMMHTANRTPLTLVRGAGSRVWDEDGHEYLDFVAGWAVDCLGHCHPALVEALNTQAKTLIQTSNQFYTVPQIQLAEFLVTHSCLDKVFFCNSGAEANEGAVKLARRYGQLNRNGAYEVISTYSSFHGRTLAMTAATGQTKFQEPYNPLPTGFVNVPYNDIEAIKKATCDKTCAVILEPLQGEGGVNVPDDGYLPAIREWCNEHNLLLILDEVQTGIGRIGTLFGYEQYGVEPDIMTLAKGLGGGVPIGAILSRTQANVFKAGEHGGTFGGNPLCCAAAFAVLSYIVNNNVLDNVTKTGQYFVKRLQDLAGKYSCITEIRGRGLLLALQFDSEIAGNVLNAALERGLLLNQVKPDALRFIPALTITRQDVDEAIHILDEAVSAVIRA